MNKSGNVFNSVYLKIDYFVQNHYIFFLYLWIYKINPPKNKI